MLRSIAVLSALTASAQSEPSWPATAEAPRPRFAVGLEAGGLFPQVLGRLSTNFNVALGVAWMTLVLDGKLALAADCGSSQPSHAETIADPRVPDTSDSSTNTDRLQW